MKKKLLYAGIATLVILGGVIHTYSSWTNPQDLSKGGGIISDPTITILSPNGGEIFQPGQFVTIRWALSGFTPLEPVTLTLALNNAPSTYLNVATFSSSASGGQATFIVPFNSKQDTKYVVKAVVSRTANDFVVSDTSNAVFTIAGNPIMPSISVIPASTASHIFPKTTNALIGSFVLKNQSPTESISVSSLKISLVNPNGVVLRNASTRPKLQATIPSLKNFTMLTVSRPNGEVIGSRIFKPSGINAIPANLIVPPGGSEILNIYATLGTDKKGVVMTTLLPIVKGVLSNLNATPALPVASPAISIY